jgi:hypothetical protein
VNLIDAVKSGKPFRRKGWGGDCFFTTLGTSIGERIEARLYDRSNYWTMNAEDVLAEDWELQEPEVRITRTQFWEAVEHAFRCPVTCSPAGGELMKLAKRLGLEP